MKRLLGLAAVVGVGMGAFTACVTPGDAGAGKAASGLIQFVPKQSAEARSEMWVVSAVDDAPVMLFHRNIDFAYDPALRGTVATVVLDLDITESGAVASATVVQATLPALAEAAPKAYLDGRFRPAIRGGKPAPCRVRIKNTFRL